MATRPCTRCRNANGTPTGVVRGGECFLCRGSLTMPAPAAVSAEVRVAAQRRMQAIDALRAAGYPVRAQVARQALEERDPARHSKLIDSVITGRTSAVIAGLIAYADTEGI